MCGLRGAFSQTGLLSKFAENRIPNVMSHRGPDFSGCYVSPAAILAHNKLAIRDTSGKSNQPISFGRWIIVFNGEIYNYRRLAAELGLGQVVFDGDVLGPGFERYGDDFWSRLDGEFAIALYELDAHSLVLVRDRVGAKPLHYSRIGTEWYFASEVKGIELGLGRRPNPDRICLDLMLGPWAPRNQTWFLDIQALAPGHYMRVTTAGAVIRQYWSLDPNAPSTGKTDLQEAIRRSIEGRSMDQNHKALLLSSGIDSGTIAALASRNAPVSAYTVHYPATSELDELEGALIAAAKAGMDCRVVEVEARHSTTAAWDAIVGALEEAPLDPGYLAVWRLYEAIKADGLRVALTGQGNDELWCGYSEEASGIFDVLGSQWASVVAATHRKRFFERASPRKASKERVPFWNGPWMREFVTESRDLHYLGLLQAKMDEAGGALAALQLGLSTVLQRNLDQEDRLAMAHSIESRLPLLSNGLIDGAAAYASSSTPHSAGRGKVAFREASAALTGWIKQSSVKQSFPVSRAICRRSCREYITANWMQVRDRPLVAALIDEGISTDECCALLDDAPDIAFTLFALDRFSLFWL